MKKTLLAVLLAFVIFPCQGRNRLPSFLKNAAYVDKKVFAEQYAIGKADWDATFDFLSNPKLDTVQLKVWNQLTDVTRARTNIVRTKQSNIYEVHHKVVDVFYVIDGVIKVGVSKPENLLDCRKPYSDVRDVEIYEKSSKTRYVTVKKGQFIVLFPSDAHSPNLCLDVPADAHVATVKVHYYTD